MRRGFVSVIGALLIVISMAGPAGASRGWCRADPTILVGGKQVQVWVLIPDDTVGLVTGPIQLAITVPRQTEHSILFTDAGFNGYGEAVAWIVDGDPSSDGNLSLRISVRVPTVDGQYLPMLVDIITEDGEVATMGGATVGLVLDLTISGQSLIQSSALGAPVVGQSADGVDVVGESAVGGSAIGDSSVSNSESIQVPAPQIEDVPTEVPTAISTEVAAPDPTETPTEIATDGPTDAATEVPTGVVEATTPEPDPTEAAVEEATPGDAAADESTPERAEPTTDETSPTADASMGSPPGDTEAIQDESAATPEPTDIATEEPALGEEVLSEDVPPDGQDNQGQGYAYGNQDEAEPSPTPTETPSPTPTESSEPETVPIQPTPTA